MRYFNYSKYFFCVYLEVYFEVLARNKCPHLVFITSVPADLIIIHNIIFQKNILWRFVLNCVVLYCDVL